MIPITKAQRKKHIMNATNNQKMMNMLRSVYIMCLYSFCKDMALITTAQQTGGLKCPMVTPSLAPSACRRHRWTRRPWCAPCGFWAPRCWCTTTCWTTACAFMKIAPGGCVKTPRGYCGFSSQIVETVIVFSYLCCAKFWQQIRTFNFLSDFQLRLWLIR